MPTHKRILKSESGMGMLLIAIALSTSLLVAGASNLLISELRKKQQVAFKKDGITGAMNRNALLLTKKLIYAGLLWRDLETSKWQDETAASPAAEWYVDTANAQVHLKTCDFRNDFYVPVDGSAAQSSCEKVTASATLKGMLPDHREEVTVKTRLDSKSARQLSALITPPKCVPGIKSDIVDFESLGAGQTIDEAANLALQRDYGVSFNYLNSGGHLAIAEVVQEGDPEPAFKAWMSVLCANHPNHNRMCNGGSAGARVLSSTDALHASEISLQISFRVPVKNPSFDLIDVDGGETWTIVAYGPNNQVVDHAQVKKKGYGSGSGNSSATGYEVASTDEDISRIVLTGRKRSNIFGFGFDNFRTSIPVCGATPPPVVVGSY